MDNRARLRWVILLLALGATVAAIIVPAEEMHEVVAPEVRARTHARPAAVQGARTEVMPQPFESEAEADPFAVAKLEAPPPAPVPEMKAAVPEAFSETQPPQAPPIPFKFVGRFSDDAGAFVYLANGETAHAVRMGDLVIGTYKVISIQSREMVFEHVPTGITQSLSLPDPDQ